MGKASKRRQIRRQAPDPMTVVLGLENDPLVQQMMAGLSLKEQELLLQDIVETADVIQVEGQGTVHQMNLDRLRQRIEQS